MSDQFRQWLTSEMEKRRYSQGALARAIGMSRPFITRVLNGERAPSLDFLIKVAQALDVPPEKVLRLAGILPTSPASEDDPTMAEIHDILKNLPPQKRKKALSYLKFLYQSETEE